MVLVTHKLAEIKKVAHRATVLRGGRVVAQSSAPAQEIGRLVRAMIQRDLDGLGVGASAMLGERRPATTRRRLAAAERRDAEAGGRRALQVDGLDRSRRSGRDRGWTTSR